MIACDGCKTIMESEIYYSATLHHNAGISTGLNIHLCQMCASHVMNHRLGEISKFTEKEEQELRDKNIKIMEIDMTERNY